MQAQLIPEHQDEGAFTLRPYQQHCINALAHFGVDGGKRALVVLPTGSGKTVIFAEIAGTASRKVLVLAHREELLIQAQEKILRTHPNLIVELEQAGNKASDNADVVIGSIQTFAVSETRLQRFNPADFSAVVVDEAHHATARTYLQVLSYFGLAPKISDLTGFNIAGKSLKAEVLKRFTNFEPSPNAPFLAGFTATPSRTDGQGLEYVFDEIVFSRTIREMMEDDWLCKIRAIRVDTATDISRVKTRMGDYQERALSQAVNTDDRNDLAVKAYLDHAKGRQGLIFCVDVEHTKEMTKVFKREGIATEYVVGAKSQMEHPRDEVIRDYQSGKVQILVNCMVLTEGFDAPDTSCIIMARPTKSQLLYTQMLGRGTRVAPGKDDLLVIDLADTASIGVADVNSLFGLPPRFKMEVDSDVLTARRGIDEIESQISLVDFEAASSISELKTIAAAFDPLAARGGGLPGNLAWTRASFGYVLGLFNGQQMGIVEDPLGKVEVRLKQLRQKAQVIGKFENSLKGIEAAEAWIKQYRPDDYTMQDSGAEWRNQAPTFKQREYAQRLGIEILEGMTKGDVSNLINTKVARR